MGKGRDEIKKRHGDAAETVMRETRTNTSTKDAQQMGGIQRTGAWISVLPSTVNGTELGPQEWRYSLFLRYGIDPPDLPDHFDSCGSEFSI